MGIRKGITTASGLTVENAYHRIKTVRGTNGGGIRYEVEVFLSEDAKSQGLAPLEQRLYNVPGDLQATLGVITELYNIMKQEPEYEGAEDVYESLVYPYVSAPITEGYVLLALITDGLQLDNSVVAGTLSGKFLYDGYVVSGTLSNATTSILTASGESFKNAHILSANLDGYVVQVLR